MPIICSPFVAGHLYESQKVASQEGLEPPTHSLEVSL